MVEAMKLSHWPLLMIVYRAMYIKQICSDSAKCSKTDRMTLYNNYLKQRNRMLLNGRASLLTSIQLNRLFFTYWKKNKKLNTAQTSSN